MYLQRLYQPLAQVDDTAWQKVLEDHAWWQSPGARIDDEHQDIAFHILMQDGAIANNLQASDAGFEFDAVPVPTQAFQDCHLIDQVERWSAMHAANYGAGLTTKMGLYVMRAGGNLGFHTDGPVFLKGMRADLTQEHVQRGLVELHASHRTILPLRFNAEDRFMICGLQAPLQRGELFEFSNVLPHAYFNCGPQHAVLLVTTYLEEALLPEDYVYARPEP